MTPFQKFKQRVWYIIYPIFPRVEHLFLFIHGNKRQRFHVGWLAPHHTVAGLKTHLSNKWGFGNHFIAWEDDKQILSWRKLDSFKKQYHLRLYSDGEIRGHYELTPEAAPIAHLHKTEQTPRTKDFLEFLGSFVTTQKYISHISPDTTVPSRDSEVTFDKV
jgi:hypothetical protein